MVSVQTDAGVYFGGGWQRGRGADVDVLDPADASLVATVAGASPEQVVAALDAARDAQREWRRTPAAARGGLIRRIADLMQANRDTLADLLVHEVGKRRPDAEGEVDFAAAFLRYNAEWDTRLEGEILPGEVAGETVHLMRVPVGVVAAICPWNYPLAVLCRKIGPALVTGNTVVIKPSEISPLSTMALIRLIDERLDVPAGVLNLVVGAGDVGEALVDSGQADLVTFTGHRDTGKAVMASAAGSLTRVSLELGGKAPAIVWRDADLDVAVPAIVRARHANCGQVCTSAERVLVHHDLLEEFTDRYAATVSAFTIGPSREGADLGPLASAAQLAKTSGALATAIDEGARVVSGGPDAVPGRLSSGYFLAPTVLRDITPTMTIMHEETFGPVTPIMGIGDLDEALAVANDSRYGLSAYVFSRDYPTVMRTVDDLEFGEIYVNRTLGEAIYAHHTGWKESGLGGEDGKWGMLRYTQIKSVYHHYGTA